jgi:hypothetical protein
MAGLPGVDASDVAVILAARPPASDFPLLRRLPAGTGQLSHLRARCRATHRNACAYAIPAFRRLSSALTSANGNARPLMCL